MQNWNQWQLPSGGVTASMPQPPVGYATPGADPMAMMQAYMQYYNQPAPSGYTAEQWAAAQQQNWAQWQQWQQQYQQWQAQYGDKYQETMKQMSAQGIGLSNQAPPLPTVQPPLPPKDDAKPPLPPSTYQFTNMPPPHQNNLPLFPAKQTTPGAQSSQTNVSNCPQNPPLPSTQPPLPPDAPEIKDVGTAVKRSNTDNISESSSAKKSKVEEEELSEAEKTFDAQFKQWEEQFNKWKQQNMNHPDKTQYKEYEAKWTSWREKLIERREMMRKKREQQKQAAAKVETEKKNLPEGDKIMNILSSTENQGLINNLLGIGKSLGLTGKQNTLPPPPPPPPQTSENVQGTNTTFSTPQQTASQMPGPNMMASGMVANPWSVSQWPSQYPSDVNMVNFTGYQPTTTASGFFGPQPGPNVPPNFTQPPPNMSNATPNFSQPPPGFAAANGNQTQNKSMQLPFGSNANKSFGNDRNGSGNGAAQNLDLSNFGTNNNAKSSEQFGRDNLYKTSMDGQNNQFRSNDSFGLRSDFFGRDNDFRRNDGMAEGGESFRRDDKNYSEQGKNQFNSQKGSFNAGNDRFAAGNDRFGSSGDRYGPSGDRPGQDSDRFGSDNDRFGSGNDRFRPQADRFGSENDRFPPGNNRFGPGNNRFGTGNDRFGTANDRFETNRFGPGNDRFNPGQDRFGSNNEPFNTGSDRFGRNNTNQFEQKDGFDRRDNFNNNSRFGRSNNQFETSDGLAPELKKLMEKRKAAGDVFKPSFLTDTDRTSNVGSLSESFKKIAGNSPFISRSNNDPGPRDNLGPKGNNFGPRGPGIFGSPNSDIRSRGSNDFKPFDFGPRGPPPNFGPRGSTFDTPDAGNSDFKDPMSNNASRPEIMRPNQPGNEFEPRSNVGSLIMQNAMPVDTAANTELLESNAPINNDNMKLSEFPDQSNESGFNKKQELEKENRQEPSIQGEISSLEKPPWMDAPFKVGNLPEKDINTEQGNDDPGNFINPLKCTSKDDNEDIVHDDTTKNITNNPENSFIKKTEVLPFMGENDPKPEDLNMEPPPELPNLGPISSDINNPPNELGPCRPPDVPYDLVGPDDRFSSLSKPNDAPIGPRGPTDTSFGPRDTNEPNDNIFTPRGPNISSSFGPPGSHNNSFGPRGPSDTSFGPFGPGDRLFGSRGVDTGPFGARGPLDGSFGPRNLADSSFRPGGSVEGPFGPRGPSEGPFGPRGAGEGPFGPRGPGEGPFGPRGPGEGPFGPRGPDEGPFGTRGPGEGPFGPRGPGDNLFGPRGPGDNLFGPRGPTDSPFGPRGPNNSSSNSPFGPRGSNSGPFEPRGPNDGLFGAGPNDSLFGPRVPGPNDGPFGLRGPGNNSFGPRDPSNTPFGPRGSSNDPPFGPQGFNDGPFSRGPFPPRDVRNFTERPFGILDQNNSSFGPPGPNDRQFRPRGGPLDNSFAPRDLNKEPGIRNQNNEQFGNTDHPQRAPPFNNSETDDFRNKSIEIERSNSGNITHPERNPPEGLLPTDPFSNMQRRPGGGSSNDYNKFSGSDIFMKRSMERQPPLRGTPNKEFCIERQFNYNHGNVGTEKKYIEHVPVKVIDYSHAPRSITYDYLTPAQCFDYGHGTLKPVVPDHEIYPQKDFRNWEENEQNLRDYTERMKRYENFVPKRESKKWITDRNHGRTSERFLDDKKYERERREKNDYKQWERDCEDRRRDNIYDKNQDKRLKENEKKDNQDKPQEKCDWSRKDASKEKEKSDDRSKGNISWQEGSNKNTTETKIPDISTSDKHNVPEAPPKTLELAKTPNCTMVDDLLCPPGRQTRPPKIAIILRGPPGSGKSFVAKLIKDKEVEQGGSAPRILSLDDYFLVEKEIETKDDNGKKITTKEMVYEYEEAMEPSYVTSLLKAFKKNITDGFFNFIILDSINEKISDYEEMWSFANSKGFKVYVCEMEMDVQICLKRNIHNRSEDEINRIIDYFEPTPSYHQKLDVNSMLQEQAIEEVHMEDTEIMEEDITQPNEDSQDSQEDASDTIGVSKWERMEAEDKLDRLDGLAKRKHEGKPQTMEDFLQVPDYYNMEDTSGKKRVRWADLEERKEQEKMRAVGFVVGHTNWDRMMDPTKGGSALTRTKFFSLS